MEKATDKRDTAIIRYQLAVKKLSRFLNAYFCPLFILLSVFSLIFFDIDNWDGQYFDCDGYMRAIRIYNWLLNPSFFEQPIFQSNYPFGEVNHWTRPMDIIWLINMLPFLYMDNLKDIIFMGGVFLSPWLYILSALALIYGLRRQFNIYLTIFGCFILISDPLLQLNFVIGRPDHHALMALLGIYTLSLILCWLKKRHLRYLRLLGFTLALLTFTAIEGFILYCLVTAFYLFLYIYKNHSLISAVKIAKYYMIALTIFWLLNPPYEGYFYADNGRLSILYVVLSALLFAVFYGLNLCRLHTPILKIWSLICAALSTGLILLLIFGTEIYNFPLDSEIQSIWSNQISEMRSFHELPTTKQIAIYGFSFLSLITAFFLLHFKPYRRLMSLTLILGIPLFILNLWAVRFANYQFLYNIIPWLCLTEMTYNQHIKTHGFSIEMPNRIPSLCLGILLLQQFCLLPLNIKDTEKKPTKYFYSQLFQNVKKIGGTLVTDNFLSAVYVWQSDVNTVGTAYHRNKAGLIDNHRILNSEDDKELMNLILKHHVTQILVFDGDYTSFDMAPENHKKLYYRLIKRQNLPTFVTEIQNSDKNTRHYRIKI